MPKYIELEAAIQAAKEPTIYDLTDVPEWLSSLPTVDAVPVVYGRWEFDAYTAKYGKPYRCSECKEEYTDTRNYCPECGARMDGE